MRAERYGLEPAAMSHVWGKEDPPSQAEVETSKAISLKRIADAMADWLTAGCQHEFDTISAFDNQPAVAACTKCGRVAS